MVDTNKNTLLYVVIAKVSIKRYKDSNGKDQEDWKFEFSIDNEEYCVSGLRRHFSDPLTSDNKITVWFSNEDHLLDKNVKEGKGFISFTFELKFKEINLVELLGNPEYMVNRPAELAFDSSISLEDLKKKEK
jgi:hypothetical protein